MVSERRLSLIRRCVIRWLTIAWAEARCYCYLLKALWAGEVELKAWDNKGRLVLIAAVKVVSYDICKSEVTKTFYKDPEASL